jgi:hypothetical protein
MRVKVRWARVVLYGRACTWMHRRESLDGCADNKQENEMVRVKRDYALGQIGYPRVS